MRNLKFLFVSVLSLGLFMGCSDDDDNPLPVNQEEVITTLKITLTPQDGGPAIIFEKRDLDGDGPNEPIISVSGDLKAETAYSGSIAVLNETQSPPEVITNEIQEENKEHQFFFSFGYESLSDVTYADADADGNPVGLSFVLTTAAATTETLRVILKHDLNKFAEGVSEGAIENAGGEIDIDGTFNFDVVN